MYYDQQTHNLLPFPLHNEVPSGYADNISVTVLVSSLSIVFASAIGLWFESRDGSPLL